MKRPRSGPGPRYALAIGRLPRSQKHSHCKSQNSPWSPAQPLFSHICPIYFQFDHAAVAKIAQYTTQHKLPAHDHVHATPRRQQEFHRGRSSSSRHPSASPRTTPNVVVFCLIPQKPLAVDPTGPGTDREHAYRSSPHLRKYTSCLHTVGCVSIHIPDGDGDAELKVLRCEICHGYSSKKLKPKTLLHRHTRAYFIEPASIPRGRTIPQLPKTHRRAALARKPIVVPISLSPCLVSYTSPGDVRSDATQRGSKYRHNLQAQIFCAPPGAVYF